MTDEKTIPRQTFKRLPEYYNLLSALKNLGIENVSSAMIADALNLNHVVVRKDLALASEKGGRPRKGYNTATLITDIAQELGYYNVRDAVLIGAGRLGHALLSYEGFKHYGVEILAAFDLDGQEAASAKPILPMSELDSFCKNHNIRIGIITVPAHAAQKACDLLIGCGILAVWNFAPVHLTAPDNVYVQNENMAVSLSMLSQHLNKAIKV